MTAPPPPPEVDRLVADLFRRAAGRLVAALARRFGPRHLDLAEEAVQDALLRALQSWPYTGVPAAPEAWLYRVALNRGLDALRRAAVGQEKIGALAHDLAAGAAAGPPSIDDELAMMFMCCHPALPHPARLALTLKTVGGLGVNEIAAAFLAEPAAIAQRLVRAKKQIRDQRLPLEVPAADELPERLASVLEAVYLLFNEGYSAHDGDNPVRADLCAEAVRLTRLMLASPRTALPHVHALLALMLFHGARLPARATAAGDILLLDEQDRARWDRAMIDEAFRHFARSLDGPKTTYHVEAAIASMHAAAPAPAATDWRAVCALYDELMTLKPSPVAALNRAVALGMAEGPAAGLAALEALAREPALASYHLLPAACGAFHLKAGDCAAAAAAYRAALAMPCAPAERRFLERQLARCGGAGGRISA